MSLRQPLLDSKAARSSTLDRNNSSEQLEYTQISTVGSSLSDDSIRLSSQTATSDGIFECTAYSEQSSEVHRKTAQEADEAVEGELSRQSTGGETEAASDLSLASAEERLMKLLPEGSRMRIKVAGNAITVRIPPTDDICSALDLWSHKKLVLAWGLFFFLLFRFTWFMYHGIYPGFEPFRFGAVLLVFTAFRFSLKLTVSGALTAEEIQLQPQKLVVRRESFCRAKTASVDKCEILNIEMAGGGILVKCAGVAMFGLPRRFLVGRCLSLPEREILAAFLRGYACSGGDGGSSVV